MKYCLPALLCLLSFATANAIEVPTLYTAQVQIDQEEDDPRAAAYETALAVVLLRVSGGQVVDDPELFEALFPDPAAYVVQFRPGPDETLFVSFDGEAVETVLRNAGQSIWGSDRPLTLIWLAVDWGGGEREILGATDDERDASRSINRNRMLRERILDFAERRGLPVAFPLLDSEDLANVGFSDVRRIRRVDRRCVRPLRDKFRSDRPRRRGRRLAESLGLSLRSGAAELAGRAGTRAVERRGHVGRRIRHWWR